MNIENKLLLHRLTLPSSLSSLSLLSVAVSAERGRREFFESRVQSRDSFHRQTSPADPRLNVDVRVFLFSETRMTMMTRIVIRCMCDDDVDDAL